MLIKKEGELCVLLQGQDRTRAGYSTSIKRLFYQLFFIGNGLAFSFYSKRLGIAMVLQGRAIARHGNGPAR